MGRFWWWEGRVFMVFSFTHFLISAIGFGFFFLSEFFVFVFDGLDFDLSFSWLGIMRFTMLIILGALIEWE